MTTALDRYVDLDRNPLRPDTPGAAAFAARCRAELANDGVCRLEGFLTDHAVAALAAEADTLTPKAHRSEGNATPYLEPAAADVPDGHPRRTLQRSSVRTVAYDTFTDDSGIRALYEDDELLAFLTAVVGSGALYRYDDPLGGLNLAVMQDGDELGWHFDQTDFVVSIALQASEAGGDFECVRSIRNADDPNFADVAAVLTGDADDRIIVEDMVPGTLMLFRGRDSLHRVTRIEGDTPRLVALLGYDTKSGTCSSERLRMARYGRLA